MNTILSKNQDVELRRARLADVPLAVPLVQEFVDEAINTYGLRLDVNVVLNNFKSFVDYAVVAYAGERMVGVLAGKVDDFDLSDQKIFQEHIWYVSKDYRKLTGVKLLSLMEQELSSQGIKFMVMVHLGNERSEAIGKYYERLGFRPLETHYIKQLGG